MKFEDLTDRQLKQVIRIYRLHLLEDLKGYTKFERTKLVNLCKKLFDIDDEKIKPKVSEPIYFDFPVYKPKAKKQPKAKPTQKEQPMQKEEVEPLKENISHVAKLKDEYYNIRKQRFRILTKLRDDINLKYGDIDIDDLINDLRVMKKYKETEKLKKKVDEIYNKFNIKGRKSQAGALNFLLSLSPYINWKSRSAEARQLYNKETKLFNEIANLVFERNFNVMYGNSWD